MASCGLKSLRRRSSSGQPSPCDHGLKRSTSCGAFLPVGTPAGDTYRREMLLGAFSFPVAAAVSTVCMASPKPGTGEPEPVADVGGLELRPRPSEESLAILFDVMACMSTLYGHTCQHLREVCIQATATDCMNGNLTTKRWRMWPLKDVTDGKLCLLCR